MKPFEDEVLSYDKVYERFCEYAAWLLRLYVNTMNVIIISTINTLTRVRKWLCTIQRYTVLWRSA